DEAAYATYANDPKEWRKASNNFRSAGHCYIKSGNLKEAVHSLREAANLSEDANDWRKVGKYAIKINDFKTAAHSFNKAANISDDIDDWREAKKYFTKIKNYKSANYASNQVLRILKNNNQSHQLPFLDFQHNQNNHYENNNIYQYS
ncbi:hypothetical protein ACR9PT_14245, partial [Piscirickettsia salmonis]